MMTVFEYFAGVGSGVLAASGVFKFMASGWLAKHLQTHKADLDRDMENHKDTLGRMAERNRLMLKREELMFELELDAAKELHQFTRELAPEFIGPFDDAEAYLTTMAEKIWRYARYIHDFLIKHEIALSLETTEILVSAQELANEIGQDVAQDGTVEGGYKPEEYASQNIQDDVRKFIKLLIRAKERARTDLQKGSFGVE